MCPADATTRPTIVGFIIDNCCLERTPTDNKPNVKKPKTNANK